MCSTFYVYNGDVRGNEMDFDQVLSLLRNKPVEFEYHEQKKISGLSHNPLLQ